MNKLITGELRVGVSKLLVQRALADAFAVDGKRIAQRMMGYTDARATPAAASFRALVSASDTDGNIGQPYPFFLAHPLDVPQQSSPRVSVPRPIGSWNGSSTAFVRR